MEKETRHFTLGNKKIVADILPAGSLPHILCIHGAGTSSRSRYTPFREALASRGLSSVAVDLSGWGESDGTLSETSLENRTNESYAVITGLSMPEPLTIVGGSMGGYNAIKLTEKLVVQNLVLVAPGVYHTDTYQIPFGEAFSEAIRVSRSWEHTDAWKILESFTGNLLIVTGDKDEVVPFEIIQRLYDSATSAATRDIVVFPGITHSIWKYLNENPDKMDIVIQKIRGYLK